MLLRDHIYASIRRSILSGEFLPGLELREQMLAATYRVSRSPIRDSLLRLEQENLVTVLPRRGYLVSPISIADVENMFALRLLIEPACAAAAAQRDDAAVRGLDRFRFYAGDGTIKLGFCDYNLEFHRAVADLSGNARLAAVAHDLTDQFDRLVRISIDRHKVIDTNVLVREHSAIVDAIQAHDAGAAARLSTCHAMGGRSRIVGLLRQIAGTPGNLETPASGDGEPARHPAVTP